MIRYSRIAAARAFALTISACSGNDAPDAGAVTETQMDDVDVIDGTISDEMVDVDTIKEVDATGEETEEAAEEKDESAPTENSDSAEEPTE